MNYATIAQAISDWLNKGNIDSVIPTIIRFAQRSLEDDLRIRAMEYVPANADVNAGVGYLTLPDDYLELISLTLIKDSIRYPITYRRSIYEMRAVSFSTTETGTPSEIARLGDLLYFDVLTDEKYTREWAYYRRLPTLTAETAGTPPPNTNWWSEEAEEALLMACLDKASLYISGIPEGDKKKWAEAAARTKEALLLNNLQEHISGVTMRSVPWL